MDGKEMRDGAGKTNHCLQAEQFEIENGVLKRCRRCMPGGQNVVWLPDGLKAIGDAAFLGDKNLKGVVCPDTLEEIGPEAFRECFALETVILRGNVRKIGERAFYSCYALEAISFPAALEEIGEDAFYFCTSLRKTNVPNGVTRIGAGAFAHCKALARVHLPHSLQKLPDNMFNGCAALERIWLPESVTEIGEGALAGCGLKKLPLSGAIRKLNSRAFYGNERITRIAIPQGIQVLPESCFGPLHEVKEIFLPDTVKRIEKGAFMALGCPVYIPDSVEFIHPEAFYRAQAGIQVSIPKHLEGQLPEEICTVRK